MWPGSVHGHEDIMGAGTIGVLARVRLGRDCGQNWQVGRRGEMEEQREGGDGGVGLEFSR